MKQRTLGIAGGGQLGLMLTEAAHLLGFAVTVLDPTPQSPASRQADRQIVGDFADAAAVHSLAASVDVLTFEIEATHAGALADIAAQRQGQVQPLPDTLGRINDKLAQKTMLAEAGVPVAPFTAVADRDAIVAAAERFSYPVVLKSRRGGYDGRGNATIHDAADIDEAMAKLAGAELYVEQFIPFAKELAVVAARTKQGEVATYPVVETVHRNHICHTVLAPAPVAATMSERATAVAHDVLRLFNGAGVFGIELFLTPAGQVLVNEIAPRVHNSGHFTIEGCETSQFEQHVRAVADLPLGSTAMRFPATVMVNILGDRTGPANPQGVAEAEVLGNVKVHIYGKQETRPERKMGHLTTWGATLDEAQQLAETARSRVSI